MSHLSYFVIPSVNHLSYS